MEIPIVVFHVNGNQQYFKNCVYLSSCNNHVYVIGDNSNKNSFTDNTNVTFVHIDDLHNPEIDDFKQYFTNYSKSDYTYEINCFLRVFYLKTFLLKTGHEKVFHTDSDCAIFYSMTRLFHERSQIQVAYSLQTHVKNEFHMAGCIHNALLNLEFCEAFIQLCVDIYQNKTKLYLIEPKIKWHQDNDIGGGVCDMTLYHLLYSEKLIENIVDLNDLLVVDGESATFDHNFSNLYGFLGENTYKKLYYGKQLIVANDLDVNVKLCKKIYFVTNENVPIRTLSLHFQGGVKILIVEKFSDFFY